jgi:hypothetical protein
MKKSLYVHLGMPKAGSTALQEFLCMNLELLEKNGLFYPNPRSLEQFSHNPQEMKGHHIVPMYMTGFFWAYFPKKEGISAEDIFKYIRQQIENSAAQKVLLSSEAFWFMLNRQDVVDSFAGAFSDFNLKVIVYLRRQDDHIQSGYNECIKSSFYTMTVDEFIEDRFLDPSNNYYTHLMRWVKAIGKVNIIARVYDKNCLVNGSIFEDLLSGCGLGWIPGLKLPERDANPRMSLNALMFQRLINVLFDEHKIRENFSNFLMQWSVFEDVNSTKAFAVQSLLNAGQRGRIYDRYSMENKRLAETFLSAEEKHIFLSEKPETGSVYPGLTIEKSSEVVCFIRKTNPELFGILMQKSFAKQPVSAESREVFGFMRKAIELCITD